ncbi:hypothetical protein C5167_039945 [Papaver somniferum]|uniref:Flavodoxin-like domain-containing protein n=2 Tax=Papaver somniferum TaxID=3469 RepID=A0A4Y7IG13_PAPSO|nr:hypothetical protein C5167_039945 [Papaver somniferum]
MASPSPTQFSAALVLLCLLVFSFSTTTSSSKVAVAVAVAPPQVNEHTISKSSVAASVEKVSLTVYYSSQSVRSANFIAYNLMKILENGLIDFVDLKLVPFGKSRLLKNGTILCESTTQLEGVWLLINH